ncbi:MAG: Omp28-related outer membrane protein [Limnohabitans sp.]|nr:Omp28-related outer membrane protein [Limnohabitans sp.]
MKKITILAIMFGAFYSNAQTIVSTTPQNKKVILEEFTGIHCGYCPQGHALAKSIQDANPGNVFLINVHAGGYAAPNMGEPDFRTPFGTAIDSQAYSPGGSAYPGGTVNRTVFPTLAYTTTPSASLAMMRDKWSTAANTILGQSSYVNVATTATVNSATRQMTVLVEAYYTAGSPVPTNKLNVALLQNNTKGPQSGGGAGSNYNHMHRLVHMVTGQWGEDITTTTAGTFVTRTYNYTIPASYNSVAVDLKELEIVAFVAEGQQKIISGNSAFVIPSGLPANDMKFVSLGTLPVSTCATTISPKVEIRNMSSTALTTLPITCNINGVNQTYNWSGAPWGSMETKTIVLSNMSFTPQATNTMTISLPADANLTDNSSSAATFAQAPTVSSQNITIKMTLDQYGAETSWKLYNSAGTVVRSSPTYTNAAAAGTYPQADINLTLPNDCYKFEILDSFGDGMNPGSYQIMAGGVQITGMTGGAFGAGETKGFKILDPLDTTDFTKKIATIYPNPSHGIITLDSESSFNVTVIDYTGKEIYRQNGLINKSQIDLSNVQRGVYFVKMKNETGEQVEKVILE